MKQPTTTTTHKHAKKHPLKTSELAKHGLYIVTTYIQLFIYFSTSPRLCYSEKVESSKTVHRCIVLKIIPKIGCMIPLSCQATGEHNKRQTIHQDTPTSIHRCQHKMHIMVPLAFLSATRPSNWKGLQSRLAVIVRFSIGNVIFKGF